MSVAEQCIPPTINYRDFDPDCDLWVVTEATPRPIRYALSNNIGLGGHNGAVIVKRYDGDCRAPGQSRHYNPFVPNPSLEAFLAA
jgi:hypothetical protein